MGDVKRYRPTVVKDGNCRHGFGVRMVTSDNPADSDWRGEDSRQWIAYSDYAALQATLAARDQALAEARLKFRDAMVETILEHDADCDVDPDYFTASVMQKYDAAIEQEPPHDP